MSEVNWVNFRQKLVEPESLTFPVEFPSKTWEVSEDSENAILIFLELLWCSPFIIIQITQSFNDFFLKISVSFLVFLSCSLASYSLKFEKVHMLSNGDCLTVQTNFWSRKARKKQILRNFAVIFNNCSGESYCIALVCWPLPCVKLLHFKTRTSLGLNSAFKYKRFKLD